MLSPIPGRHPRSAHFRRDKPDYRGPSLVLSFACRPMHICCNLLIEERIGTARSACAQVSRTGLDWLLGMSHRRFSGRIVAVTHETRSVRVIAPIRFPGICLSCAVLMNPIRLLLPLCGVVRQSPADSKFL
jgi:hypothetical protein